jgi:hypothetical protein
VKTTFSVLYAIALILGLASTVAANSQLRIALQVQSATNWQYAAQVVQCLPNLSDRRCPEQGMSADDGRKATTSVEHDIMNVSPAPVAFIRIEIKTP